MCDCIQKINELLKEGNMNSVLDVPVMVSSKTRELRATCVCVSTIKDDPRKRGKPKRVFAIYCPFCGEKYPEGKES